MALANEPGNITSLKEDGSGVIELEREGIAVAFDARCVSSEFTRGDVGPIEVGKRVKVWAVKLPINPTYEATLIESDVEPLVGADLFLAMLNLDDSLACIKGTFDPVGHASRESLDTMLEESWNGYSVETDCPQQTGD